MPTTFPPEKADLSTIIKPSNVQCVLAALDPAFSIDFSGMAAVVAYTFDREQLLVGHVSRVPGAGASSLDLVRAHLNFVTDVRQRSGAPTAATYTAVDATKDRSVIDRLFELVGDGGRTGRGFVAMPPLTGIMFSGSAGQAKMVNPIVSEIPGRGRFSCPCWSVPKLEMYVRLREILTLQQLKLAPGEATQELLRELQNLEAKVSAARRVLIQPGTDEVHDDLSDALAMAVWLAHRYDGERIRAMRRASMPRKAAPSWLAWT
jgi:hypothetical protein